jgi:protein translocase SecG subunit
MINTLNNYLPYIQIVVSILLIISILLQQTGVMAGMGGTFGGGDSSIKSTRRGLEKTLLKFTIFLSVLFFIISILLLIK